MNQLYLWRPRESGEGFIPLGLARLCPQRADSGPIPSFIPLEAWLIELKARLSDARAQGDEKFIQLLELLGHRVFHADERLV